MLSAQDVRGKTFTATKFREGYVSAEVDALLARVAAALEPGAGRRDHVSADDVVQARFNSTKFKAGYDQDEVDDFLDEVVSTLRARTGGAGAAGGPLPGASAEQLRAPALRLVGQGYARGDTDRLMARAADAVEVASAGRSSVGVLSAATLLAARLPRSTGEGYDPAQVDDLLEEALVTLARHERATG